MPAFLTASKGAALAGCLGVAAGLFGYFRKAGWLVGPHRMDSIVWNADGRWFMTRGGQSWEATLRRDSWIQGFAILLRWDPIEGSAPPSSMLLTASDLGPVVFRRLGIRLRIEGLQATIATDSLLA